MSNISAALSSVFVIATACAAPCEAIILEGVPSAGHAKNHLHAEKRVAREDAVVCVGDVLDAVNQSGFVHPRLVAPIVLGATLPAHLFDSTAAWGQYLRYRDAQEKAVAFAIESFAK